MKEPVQRSAPVKIIMHSPYGKIRALIVRIRPGAFSWNQGVALVLRTDPQANASKHPAETELKNTLSRRMLPLCTPALATASTTSAGENASRVMVCCFGPNLFNTMGKSLGHDMMLQWGI